MNKIVVFSLVTLITSGCWQNSATTVEAVPVNTTDSYKTKGIVKMSSPIQGLDYPELFAMGEGTRLLATQESIAKLEAFVRDSSANPYERLLVAELLHSKQGTYLLDNKEMANLHAQAIVHARMHNPWGLPGEPIAFGDSLLTLGASVEEALRPLLDNKTELIYFGSEEPTIASMYDYRIADLAAGILAARKGIAFIDNRNQEARDQWIRENF